jgi:hypothetical protein
VSDFEKVARYAVNDTPDYTCVLDEFRRGEEQLMLVHLDMHKATPRAMRTMLRDWRLLRECLECPLFAYGEVDDHKYTKFMALLGFKPISFIPCTDGCSRRVFVSFKDFTNGIEDDRKEHHGHGTEPVGAPGPVPY